METKKVAVIGAGTMGNGIAQISASAGLDVSFVSRSEASVEKGLNAIKASLARFVRSEKLTQAQSDQVLARIKPTTNLKEACRDAQIVIEAVYELMDLKKELFKQLDEYASPEAVLASNTSQHSITAIAAATKRPEKVIGTHFFNPPVLMRLVEVVRGLKTSDETLQVTLDYCNKIGKETVVCKKDVQGFITTRVLMAMRLECVRLLEEGVGSIEDIDKAIRLGLNHPMGQFELSDFNGVEIGYNASLALSQQYGDRYRPPQIMRNLVESGDLGRKVGKGWYEYNEKGEKVRARF